MYEQLKNILQKDNLNVYAIYDASLYENFIKILTNTTLSFNSLFVNKEFKSSLVNVAPYLVQLDLEDENTKDSEVLLNLYLEKACIFFVSSAEFQSVLTQMQDMFFVTMESNDKAYLKFYSPSVFSTLMNTQNEETIVKIFDNIDMYYCQDYKDENILKQYSIKNNKIQINNINLTKETINV